jgi:hypothetical protein
MTTTKLVRCEKCAGRGVIAHFEHVDGGVCFACEGAGEVESRPLPVRPWQRRTLRDRLAGWYRNARKPESDPCHCRFEDVIDPDGMGWTEAGLSSALDEVPGSREAFRALGWPV